MLASGGQVDANQLGFLVDHVINEAGILVTKPIVVLPPHQRTEQVIQGSDRPPPGNVTRHLQPLGMLVEHRIHDVDEGLVTGKKAVPAGEQIAFQPAFTLVLAEHLKHPAIGRHMLIKRKNLRRRTPIGYLEDGIPTIRFSFVGAENQEVVRVQLDEVTDKLPLHTGRPNRHRPGFGNLHRVVAEIRHP